MGFCVVRRGDLALRIDLVDQFSYGRASRGAKSLHLLILYEFDSPDWVLKIIFVQKKPKTLRNGHLS